MKNKIVFSVPDDGGFLQRSAALGVRSVSHLGVPFFPVPEAVGFLLHLAALVVKCRRTKEASSILSAVISGKSLIAFFVVLEKNSTENGMRRGVGFMRGGSFSFMKKTASFHGVLRSACN